MVFRRQTRSRARRQVGREQQSRLIPIETDGRRGSGAEEVTGGRGQTHKENVQYRTPGTSDWEPPGSRELVPDRADRPKHLLKT